MNPRNTITLGFMLMALCSLLFALPLEAKVTGVCSNCHTMHNSQNGQAMATFGGTTGAQGCLLRGTCLGCHGQNASGTQNIIPLGNVPQVLHVATTDLAGGNFNHILKVSGSDTFGHNVRDINNPDESMTGTTPPGDEFSQTGITWGAGGTFTCAGKYGCHGDRSTETESLKAIKGAHHIDDTILKFGISFTETGQGVSTGLSYRFLKGVKGGEDTDWQATSSTTDHNEYKGSTSGTEGTVSSPGGNTISGLCAECHGNFHGGSADIGGPTGTPWLRHPTDISLPGSGEYTAYTTYDLTVPVARVNIPSSPQPDVNDTNDIVMCLSCHRAHASPYFKMMRWDYKGWPASGTNGCNVCHTSKN